MILAAVTALFLAAPSVRASVDRAYLPAGAGDTSPLVHLAVRGAKEVEVSLYEVAHPTQALLGLDAPAPSPAPGPPPLAGALEPPPLAGALEPPPLAAALEPPPLAGALEPPPLAGALEPPPLAAALASLRHRAREGYAEIWRSLRGPAREAVKDVLGLERPLGAGLLASPSAPESRVRRGEKLLRSWRLPTGEAGWNYTDLEVGLLPSGLYRLEALAGAADTEILLTVSRLSLLASRTSEGSSILATDSVDGRALAGVELFARGAALGKTGPGGLWSTRAPLEGPLVGRYEGQLARVASRPEAAALGLLQPTPAEPAERSAAAIFFDRRSYAPGDEVHLWCLLRTREAGSWKIPEADQAEIQLVGRQGTVLFEAPAEVSALGVVSKDLELPSGLSAGWYSIAVAWGSERRAGEILVQSQAPAEIAARWQAPQWSPPSNPLDVALLVTDRLGKPEPGAAVHWTAEARGSEPPSDIAAGVAAAVSLGPSEVIGEGAGVTAEDGRVSLRLPPAHGEGVLALHAEAEDSAGRIAMADTELRRIQAPALLELTPDRRVLKPGRASSVALEAHALDGQPWRGRVDVHVLGVHNSAGGEAVRSELLAKVVELDAHGRGSVTLPAAPAGYLEVRAAVPESGEPLARASIFVTENGGDIPTTPDRLELVLDRHDYGRGDDVRALILTPFESGTVLVGLEPSGGPPDELVAVHGYSGVAHLKLPAAAAVARLTAAALVGGTLYRASVAVPLPERTLLLALHLSSERPLRAGQRTVLAVGATGPEGHGVPAALEISAATSAPASPSLGQLFFSAPPVPAALTSSSGADDSAFGAGAGAVSPQALQPFGPSQLGDIAWQREVATSQTARTSADDLGHAAWGARAPADAERLYVTVRGVAGPDLFGERSWVLPIAPAPRLDLDAPRWVRAGDQFDARATEVGALGCALTLEATGGALGSTRCSEPAGRVGRATAGAGDLELSSALPAEKLVAHRTVRVVATRSGAPTTAGELARALAEGLAGAAQSADPVELDCAAVRALGGLRAAEREAREVAGAVARLALDQNPTGGFGGPDGELRRDVAALRGLAALKAGTPIDGGLLGRLQRRAESLVERVADADERERWQGRLEGTPRAGRLPIGDPAELVDGEAAPIADWLGGHRPNAAGAAALAARLAALAVEAGPLDAAESAVALAALDPGEPVALGASSPASRRYRRIERQPWTDAMLAADEEPAEPVLHAVDGPIPLGAELEVALAAPVNAATRFACLRDFPPAGLAPLGAAEVSQNGLILCGPTSRDRLELSYQVRAVRAGRFQAPAAGLGVGAGPGPATWVEVAP